MWLGIKVMAVLAAVHLAFMASQNNGASHAWVVALVERTNAAGETETTPRTD